MPQCVHFRKHRVRIYASKDGADRIKRLAQRSTIKFHKVMGLKILPVYPTVRSTERINVSENTNLCTKEIRQ